MIPVVPVVTISAAHLAGWLHAAFPNDNPFVGICSGGPRCEGWDECMTCRGTGRVEPAKAAKQRAKPSRNARSPKCTACDGRGWFACECNDPIHTAIVLGVRVERVRLQVVLEGLPDITRVCVDDGHLCFPKTNPIAPFTFGPYDVRGVERRYFGTRTVPLPLGFAS